MQQEINSSGNGNMFCLTRLLSNAREKQQKEDLGWRNFFKTIRSIFHNCNNNNIELRNEHSTRSLFFSSFIGRIAFWNIGFCGERKTREPGVDLQWTLGARTRTNNKLNPQATINTGIEPRPRGEGKSPYHYFLRFSLTLLVHNGLKGFD